MFVTIKLAENVDSSTADDWNHVPGVDNPAGNETKYLAVSEVKRSSWITVPTWQGRPNQLGFSNQTFVKYQDQMKQLNWSIFLTGIEPQIFKNWSFKLKKLQLQIFKNISASSKKSGKSSRKADYSNVLMAQKKRFFEE